MAAIKLTAESRRGGVTLSMEAAPPPRRANPGPPGAAAPRGARPPSPPLGTQTPEETRAAVDYVRRRWGRVPRRSRARECVMGQFLAHHRGTYWSPQSGWWAHQDGWPCVSLVRLDPP